MPWGGDGPSGTPVPTEEDAFIGGTWMGSVSTAGKVATGNYRTGWDGREAVVEATGPSITVDGKKYQLLGYDAKGSPVYEDARVVQEQEAAKAGAQDNGQAEAEVEQEALPEWLAAAESSLKGASADARDNLTSVAKGHIMELQRGFMCFPEGDPLIENSKNVTPKDGFFDVAMHGTPRAVAFGTAEGTNMSPRLLAAIIKHNKNYHGENIRLLSCSTGVQVNGDYCFAEELANALGVIVEAPNMEVYTYRNGVIKVGDLGEGQMVQYKPNGRRRIK